MSKERLIICGDIHGEWGQLNKLINNHGPDSVIQVGDFGYWPKFSGKSFVHGQKPWNHEGVKPHASMVYWCDGNHEDHDALDSMGRMQKQEVLCYENVVYKPRGSVHQLNDGRILLFFGGARSIDKHLRTKEFDWFPREIPSENELQRALGYDKVDIVISHTVPLEFSSVSRDSFGDPTCSMLSEIWKKYKPSQWYCGHWHKYQEQAVGPTKFTCLDYPGHNGRWWIWLT